MYYTTHLLSVVIKTKPFKTKTKTWPLPTQRLKDRDTYIQ